jgi:hypothetical protein
MMTHLVTPPKSVSAIFVYCSLYLLGHHTFGHVFVTVNTVTVACHWCIRLASVGLSDIHSSAHTLKSAVFVYFSLSPLGHRTFSHVLVFTSCDQCHVLVFTSCPTCGTVANFLVGFHQPSRVFHLCYSSL